jgi:hypothetical protein
LSARAAAAKGVRIEVEEWEEPLHPDPLLRPYPTFPHLAPLFAHDLPQTSTRAFARNLEYACLQGFLRWVKWPRHTSATAHDVVQIALAHGALQS